MVKKKVKKKTDWVNLSKEQKRLVMFAVLIPSLVLGYGLYGKFNPVVKEVTIKKIWKIRHTETSSSDIRFGYVQYTTISTYNQGRYIFDEYVDVDINKSYRIKCIFYKNPCYYHLVSIEEVVVK